jgi:pyrroline-5-carboxylate reductase
MKVLVLGAGKMAGAILEGLKNEVDLSRFYIYSPSGVSAEALAKSVGAVQVKTLDEITPDYVWLGCKPQQLKDLALQINGRFQDATFVSMLAALSEKDQLNVLGVKKLIRIMPNLSVKHKKGITLISTESAKANLAQIKTLFSLIGLAKELPEAELEELTLLTGSGPALFYEFTKILSASFTSLKIEEREELARMVLLGAGLSASASTETLSTMIDGVTSKAGVTIAVLEQWRKLKMNELILDGVSTGKKRSDEIKALLHPHN